MRMPNAPTRNGMRDSSARCWIVASSWLHHSLKQRLSLQHILSRTSTARLRRRTNRCRRWRLNPLRRHKGEWRRMHEAVELHEGHLEHGDHPLMLPVSITISIMAVLVAGVALLGHRAHTEELLRQ